MNKKFPNGIKLSLSRRYLTLGFVFIFFVTGCKSKSKPAETSDHKTSLKQNIGDQFQLTKIADSAGQAVQLDFTKSEYTIVDLWFNECPPCISELNQFGDLLRGKEQKISVISISINQPGAWNQSRGNPTGQFAFFQTSLPNWKHLVLQTNDDSTLHNSISVDRVQELEKTYHVAFYPAYFVVDKNGKIIARPESAVQYIRSL